MSHSRGGNRRRFRSGDNQFLHAGLICRRDEIHGLQTFLGDRQVSDGDVPQSLDNGREQLVPGRCSDNDCERTLAEFF